MQALIELQTPEVRRNINNILIDRSVDLIDDCECEFNIYQLCVGDERFMSDARSQLLNTLEDRLLLYRENIETMPLYELYSSHELTNRGVHALKLILFLVKLRAFKNIYDISELPRLKRVVPSRWTPGDREAMLTASSVGRNWVDSTNLNTHLLIRNPKKYDLPKSGSNDEQLISIVDGNTTRATYPILTSAALFYHPSINKSLGWIYTQSGNLYGFYSDTEDIEIYVIGSWY